MVNSASRFSKPRHPVLLRLASRQVHSDAELVVLLSAGLDEFRSAEEIINEAQTEASTAMLADLLIQIRRGDLVEGRGQCACGHQRVTG